MTTHEKIQQQLNDHAIVLYIKGTPIFPQCGFSSKASGLLQECLKLAHADAHHVLYVNVLEDPEIREGIKQFSQWPTIPQLYIGGEFVGGSDIMTELYQSGELQQQVAAAISRK